MNTRYIALVAIAFVGLVSCKKERIPAKEEPQVEIPNVDDSPTISHKILNRKHHVSDVKSMPLDLNEDGILDLSYFLQNVYLAGNSNLYIGVNPLSGAATSATDQNDDEYLNMGTTYSTEVKSTIKANFPWTEDHAILGIKREAPNGNISYLGNWGSGQEQIMPIRLTIKGKMHYAWARLKFDKATEQLTLIDAAWNTIPEQELKAGAK